MAPADNLALVFPGQGSQALGMLNSFHAEFPVIATTFSEASDVLGYDLWKLTQEGPLEKLNLTEYTQPALLTASVAIWRIWLQKGGIQPALMSGHSLGEWSALVCSGVVAFADAVKLVQHRGRFMQQAVPEGQGSMAAILGLDDAAVKTACDDAMQEPSLQGSIVSPVNFNSPGQLVIAGNTSAVERAIVYCKKLGAKRAMLLPVSAPFHTELMRSASDKLASHLDSVTFNIPSIPIVHNVNARIELNPNKIKQLVIEQIYHPVLWVSCVKTLIDSGVTHIVECGPGKVLAALAKRIDRSLSIAVTDTVSDFNNALQLELTDKRVA